MREVTYKCRDIGYGIERGTVRGLWDDEIDVWGKRPLRVIEWIDLPPDEVWTTGAVTLYLFPDEILSDEEVDGP